jgi:transcription elongation factor Elf1
MESSGTTIATALDTGNDIVFACTHCATQFVVDVAAAGVTLPCQRCGGSTTVPKPGLKSAAAHAIKITELQHQLAENESQRTEITSYINQLTIQLQRWQLRLQTLNERNKKLVSELAVMRG